MLISLATLHDLELHHLDIQTTFLNGDLDEEIYLQQPQLFEDRGDDKKGVVLANL